MDFVEIGYERRKHGLVKMLSRSAGTVSLKKAWPS